MRCFLAQACENASCNWRLPRSALHQRTPVFSAKIPMHNSNNKPHTSLGPIITFADWEITTHGTPWLQCSGQIKHLNLGPCIWVYSREQVVSAAKTVNGNVDSLQWLGVMQVTSHWSVIQLPNIKDNDIFDVMSHLASCYRTRKAWVTCKPSVIRVWCLPGACGWLGYSGSSHMAETTYI